MLARSADLTWRHPRAILALVGVFVVVAGVLGAGVQARLKPTGFTAPGTPSHRAVQHQLARAGYALTPGIVVLVSAAPGQRFDARAGAVRREAGRLRAALAGVRGVRRVGPPVPARDGSSLVFGGYLSARDEDAVKVARAATQRLRSSVVRVRLGGMATAFLQGSDTVRRDLIKGEAIAFPVLAILLLIVFRGVVAALIPLATGGISILGTLLMLRVLAAVVDTSIFALNVATALGLGLAVDYALLLVSRYREELERHGPGPEAHRRVVTTAGRAVLYSALTVATAMAALTLFPVPFLYSLGAGGALVALFSAVATLLAVPALLALLGPRVNALSVRRGPGADRSTTRWHRLAQAVMRRPVAVALASAAVLLVAAIPVTATTWTGSSIETVPRGESARDVAAVLAAHYPAYVANPLAVTAPASAPPALLARVRREIDGIGAIAGSTPFTRAAPGLSYASFGIAGPALSERAQDAVRAIRALGAPVEVSGTTADFVDLKRSIVSRLPPVVALIAVTTLLLVLGLTGSLILPVKTLAMNALTLAATLGVVVAAFPQGLLAGPLGYDGPPAMEISAAVVVFAVTAGLATDYAVLVMARIKELHDAGLRDADAIAEGMARTGPVVTAAAVLLAVVFIAFTSSRVFSLQEIGLGQAVGVLIDATIVRALLVPALMRLMGRWNWWMPRLLLRAPARRRAGG